MSGRLDTRTLTARQTQVLHLAERGLSNRRIGEVLGITAGTVEQHLMSIRSLLSASSKREAIAFAKEAGLL